MTGRLVLVTWASWKKGPWLFRAYRDEISSYMGNHEIRIPMKQAVKLISFFDVYGGSYTLQGTSPYPTCGKGQLSTRKCLMLVPRKVYYPVIWGLLRDHFQFPGKNPTAYVRKKPWQLNFFTVSLQSLHIKKNHSKKLGANFYLCFFFEKKWRQQKCQVAGGYETLMMRVSFNHFYFPSDLAHKTLGFLGVFHLFASTPKKKCPSKRWEWNCGPSTAMTFTNHMKWLGHLLGFCWFHWFYFIAKPSPKSSN